MWTHCIYFGVEFIQHNLFSKFETTVIAKTFYYRTGRSQTSHLRATNGLLAWNHVYVQCTHEFGRACYFDSETDPVWDNNLPVKRWLLNN